MRFSDELRKIAQCMDQDQVYRYNYYISKLIKVISILNEQTIEVDRLSSEGQPVVKLLRQKNNELEIRVKLPDPVT